MTTDTKFRILRFLKVLNQLIFVFLMIAIVAVLAHVYQRANENVADYKVLTVNPDNATTSSSVSYSFEWCKYVERGGTIYRDWVRAKLVDGEWVDDRRYLPLTILGSSRVSNNKGCYESNPDGVPTPSIPGDYRLRIRGEYTRIVGAEFSVDEIYSSNVVRVR